MRRALRALGVALVASLAVAGLGATPARAGGSQAVVIIDTGSGSYTRVISFSGTISGFEALQLAGAGPETDAYSGQGIAICRLFGVGNDTGCLGSGSDTRYWAYFRAPAGSAGWRYSGAGAGATSVSDGDVEGWRFGAGNAPGFRSFCDVVGCAPPPEPPPPPPPAGGGGTTDGAAAGGGDTGTAGTGSATPSAGTPAPGGAPAATGEPGGAAADGSTGTTAPTTVPTTIGDSTTAERRARDDDRRALGRPVVADDDGAGSPLGVIVALALVAALAGVAVVVRRRSRRTG